MDDTQIDEKELLRCLLDTGEIMLSVGAEISRVEDTLIRMGTAYGAVRMDVFVITSCMVVTMETKDQKEWTQTRRIRKPAGSDFLKMEACNALSRQCCEQKFSIDQLEEKIAGIRKMKVNAFVDYAGSVLAAGAFCIFFGGTVKDGFAAAVFAALICWCQKKLEPVCPNRVIFNFLAAFLSGIGICSACRFLSGLNPDKIMIGDIMLLIPGIAITNACRDMLSGDTIAGSLRLTESVLWAAAIACGYLLVMVLMGGIR